MICFYWFILLFYSMFKNHVFIIIAIRFYDVLLSFVCRCSRIEPRLCMQIRLDELLRSGQVSSKTIDIEIVVWKTLETKQNVDSAGVVLSCDESGLLMTLYSRQGPWGPCKKFEKQRISRLFSRQGPGGPCKKLEKTNYPISYQNYVIDKSKASSQIIGFANKEDFLSVYP